MTVTIEDAAGRRVHRDPFDAALDLFDAMPKPRQTALIDHLSTLYALGPGALDKARAGHAGPPQWDIEEGE